MGNTERSDTHAPVIRALQFGPWYRVLATEPEVVQCFVESGFGLDVLRQGGRGLYLGRSAFNFITPELWVFTA